MTIHVCVIMNKCGITATPSQLVITASDWRTPREVVVSSEPNSQLRTIQIHHKIYETYDDVYNAGLVIPSLFVSVLQKEATFLFAFGCGMHGRLGTNSEENALAPAPFSCKWMHPVQIACGKAHSAIIDVYSNIYCFGLGTSGQLGQGDANLDASRIPLRVPSIGAVPVLLVACGSHHTMCMTAEGRVFAWGDNSYGQLGIGSKSSKSRGTPARVDKITGVRAIVCGGCHSFIVTQDSAVLASGSNVAGQLGLGDRIDRVSFERVPFFRRLLSSSMAAVTSSTVSMSAISSNNGSDGGFTIPDLLMPGEVEVACGLYHSLALCGKRVYAWGNGDDGRLGLGSEEGVLEPTLVPSFRDIPISSIACGGSHSGAIACNGEVFTWGNGQYGQLGVGSVRARRMPTKVRLLHDKGVAQLSFGEWHSMALCHDGALYAWGFGEEGQLGLPVDEQKGFQPELPHSRIALFPTIVHSLSGTGATSVRCGGSHTFVVSVLENRRQHLARLQQRVSQSEIRSESKRLRERRQTRVLQGSPLSFGRSATLPVYRENAEETARDGEAHQFFRRRSSKKNKGKARSPKCLSAREDAERERELELARSFSWKDRPLTSRTAIRNALRKEAREFQSVKSMLGELASTSSQPLTPPCSRPNSRGDGRACRASASTFISPRLARLQRQVDRATEAGAAQFKCEAILADDATASVIRAAVQDATRDCLAAGNDSIQFDVEPQKRRLRSTRESRDEEDPSFQLNLLLNALTEMEGATAAPGDDTCSEASAEIALVTSGRATCLSLEDDIRRSAFT